MHHLAAANPLTSCKARRCPLRLQRNHALKLPLVMTAALYMPVSLCRYSFVDRHAAVSGNDAAADYLYRLNGLLHHLWQVEQTRPE